MSSKREKRLVALVKPPKNVGEMTDAELDAFADWVFGEVRAGLDTQKRGGRRDGPTRGGVPTADR